MPPSMTLKGQWHQTGEALKLLREDYLDIVGMILFREALFLAGKIKEHIITQKVVPPSLSSFTLALRKLPGRVNGGGFGGSKALIIRGGGGGLLSGIKAELVNTKTTRRVAGFKGPTAFAGINRKERARGANKSWNGSLVNLGMVHELGTRSFFIPVTRRLRKFWFYLFKMGVVKAPLKASTYAIGPIRIPPRPFIGPVFDHWRGAMPQRINAGVAGEVSRRLAALGGKPGGIP